MKLILRLKKTTFSILISLLPALIGCVSLPSYLPKVSDKSYSEQIFNKRSQLTAGPESSFDQSISEDSRYMIYTSDKLGNKDIWIRKVNGGFARPLTRHNADDFGAVYSPDSKNIAFISRRNDASGDIHIIEANTDGSSSADTLWHSRPGSIDSHLAWFPDGKKLVFAGRNPGDAIPLLFILDIEQNASLQIGDGIRGETPWVSSDGQHIVYTRNGQIYEYNFVEKMETEITSDPSQRFAQPRYAPRSPDIIFIRYCDDTNFDGRLDDLDRPTIWSLRRKGFDVSASKNKWLFDPLTSSSYSAYYPFIRGPYLYFTSEKEGVLNIFKIKKNGHIDDRDSLKSIDRILSDVSDEYYQYIYRKYIYHSFTNSDASAAISYISDLYDLTIKNHSFVNVDQTVNALSSIEDLGPESIARLKLIGITHLIHKTGMGVSIEAAIDRFESLTKTAEDSKFPLLRGEVKLRLIEYLIAKSEYSLASSKLKGLEKIENLPEKITETANLLDLKIGLFLLGFEHASNYGVRMLQDLDSENPISRKISKILIEHARDSDEPIKILQRLRTISTKVHTLPEEAQLTIARLYLEKKMPVIALNELLDLLAQDYQSKSVIIEAAEELFSQAAKLNRLEMAIDGFQKYISVSKIENPEFKNKIMTLYAEVLTAAASQPKTPLSEKKRLIETAIDSDPRSIAAYRFKIKLSSQLNELNSLIDSLENKAKSSQSPFYGYLWGLALSYRVEQGRSIKSKIKILSRSIEILEDVREHYSQVTEVHQTLGWLYLQKNYWLQKYEKKGGYAHYFGEGWNSLSFGDMIDLTFDYRILNFWADEDPRYLEKSVDAFMLAYYLSPKGSRSRTEVSQNLAYSFFRMNNHPKALKYFIERIENSNLSPFDSMDSKAFFYESASQAAFQLFEYELALEFNKAALLAWQSVGRKEQIAKTIDFRALIFREKKDFINAQEMYQKLLGYQTIEKNKYTTKINLGYTYYKQKEFAMAEGIWLQLRKDLNEQRAQNYNSFEYDQWVHLELTINSFLTLLYQDLGNNDAVEKSLIDKIEIVDAYLPSVSSKKLYSSDDLIHIKLNAYSFLLLANQNKRHIQKAQIYLKNIKQLQAEQSIDLVNSDIGESYINNLIGLADHGILGPDEFSEIDELLAKEIDKTSGEDIEDKSSIKRADLKLTKYLVQRLNKYSDKKEKLHWSQSEFAAVINSKKMPQKILIASQHTRLDLLNESNTYKTFNSYKKSLYQDSGLNAEYLLTFGLWNEALEKYENRVAEAGEILSSADEENIRIVLGNIISNDMRDISEQYDYLDRYYNLKILSTLNRFDRLYQTQGGTRQRLLFSWYDKIRNKSQNKEISVAHIWPVKNKIRIILKHPNGINSYLIDSSEFAPIWFEDAFNQLGYDLDKKPMLYVVGDHTPLFEVKDSLIGFTASSQLASYQSLKDTSYRALSIIQKGSNIGSESGYVVQFDSKEELTNQFMDFHYADLGTNYYYNSFDPTSFRFVNNIENQHPILLKEMLELKVNGTNTIKMDLDVSIGNLSQGDVVPIQMLLSYLGVDRVAIQLSSKTVNLGLTKSESLANSDLAAEMIDEIEEKVDSAEEENDWDGRIRLLGRLIHWYLVNEDLDSADEAMEQLAHSAYRARKFGLAYHAQKFFANSLNKEEDSYEYCERILVAIAFGFWDRKYKQIHDDISSCKDLAQIGEENLQLAQFIHYEALVAEKKLEYELAIAKYLETIQLYDDEGEELEKAQKYKAIGNIYANRLNKFKKAIDYFNRAIAIFGDHDENIELVKVQIDLAKSLITVGNINQAEKILSQSSSEIDAASHFDLWVRISQNQAIAKYRTRQIGKSEIILNKILEEIAKKKNRDLKPGDDRRIVSYEIDAFNLKAMLLAEKHEFKQSFELFSSILDLAKKNKFESKVAFILSNYGFWKREFGEYEQSIALFEQAKAIDKKLQSEKDLAFDFRNIGLSQISSKRPAVAVQSLTESKEMSKRIRIPYNLIYSHLGLGQAYMLLGDYEKSLAEFNSAISVGEEFSIRQFIVSGQYGKSLVYHSQGKLSESFKEIKKAIESIGKAPLGQKYRPSKSHLISEVSLYEIYDQAIKIAFLLNDAEQALYLSELGKMRTFLESFYSIGIAHRDHQVQRLFDEYRAAREMEVFIESLSHSSDLEGLGSQLKNAIKKREAIFRELVIKDKVFFSVYNGEMANNLIDRKIKSNFLSFWVGKENVFVFKNKGSKLSLNRLAIPSEKLKGLVSDYKDVVMNYSTPFIYGNKISKYLGLSGDWHNSELIISPHLWLNQLSFSSLPIEKKYLIDFYQVRYLPFISLASLKRNALESKVKNLKILAVANSEFEDQLSQLPFAKKEVDSISRYFSHVDSLVNSEHSLMKMFNPSSSMKYDILHIASHGEFEPKNSYLSGIKLREGGQYKTVPFKDFTSSPMNPKLIVFSACEALRPKDLGDYHTLAAEAPFLLSQTQSVIGNLWRVDDVSSAVVMKRFYRYLSEGFNPAKALRMAQLKLKDYFSHPIYWGGYKYAGL